MNNELIKEFVNTLIKNNLTISTVESFTGGLAASSIVSIPHASNIYKGGVVVYNKETKSLLLDIDINYFDNVDVVSKKCCETLLNKGYEKFKTDIVIAFTGNAGPLVDKNSLNQENSKVGLVYIGIKYKNTIIIDEIYKPMMERNELREYAVEQVFEKILKIFKKSE